MKKLNQEIKSLIKDAAERLTGFERRAYQARITPEYFDGSSRKSERQTGWGRECVEKGLREAESGIRCSDNYQGRGRKRRRRNYRILKRTCDPLSNLTPRRIPL